MPVSIHAPLTGCDSFPEAGGRDSCSFNPRTPYGVRPLRRSALGEGTLFQSTHPLRGATLSRAPCSGTVAVSIHAPLTGCDVVSPQREQVPRCFNPRTPYGVRHIASIVMGLFILFQSTHPLRGATTPPGLTAAAAEFQSTHPLRGATSRALSMAARIKFQSTHPLRGATGENTPAAQRFVVSIHAPLTGCDR